MALYRAQAFERALNEGRVAALRETLGFLAHELNTPLMTVRGCVSTLAARHLPAAPDAPAGMAQFTEHHPGELLAALERAERRALYCQSLVSTFVQSARDAYPGAAVQTVSAASLVAALLDEFPFEESERSWVGSAVVAGLPPARPPRLAVPRALHPDQECAHRPARHRTAQFAYRGRAGAWAGRRAAVDSLYRQRAGHPA